MNSILNIKKLTKLVAWASLVNAICWFLPDLLYGINIYYLICSIGWIFISITFFILHKNMK